MPPFSKATLAHPLPEASNCTQQVLDAKRGMVNASLGAPSSANEMRVSARVCVRTSAITSYSLNTSHVVAGFTRSSTCDGRSSHAAAGSGEQAAAVAACMLRAMWLLDAVVVTSAMRARDGFEGSRASGAEAWALVGIACGRDATPRTCPAHPPAIMAASILCRLRKLHSRTCHLCFGGSALCLRESKLRISMIKIRSIWGWYGEAERDMQKCATWRCSFVRDDD